MIELNEELIRRHFIDLREKELIDEMIEVGIIDEIAEGNLVMDVGRYIRSVPLIIKGTVRIMREDEEGRELFLYYLKPGETCAVSLTCCMAQERSSIRAIADEDTVMLRIPVEKIDQWSSRYTSWKNYVMGTYRQRYEELLYTIDSIAFMKMDERLWRYLIEKSAMTNRNDLQITHQEIADALHSTREVISRLLKALEKQGRIQLGRNKIKVIEEEL
ncbi:MAG: Crp/Fnr family transcriptional regulator [Cyclobacteriaceae bacterium]|nr:Crp/Fnr family transcriptional regulator [Cyclobacteriaceae bacterium]